GTPRPPPRQRLATGVLRHRGCPGIRDAECLLQIGGMCLDRLVCRRAELELAEPLDTCVRLPENLEAEHDHEDEQGSDGEERDEQLRAQRRRRAGDEADEPVLQPARARPPSRGRLCEHFGLGHSACLGYGLSVAVEPAELVISHVPLTFWSVCVTPASDATFFVVGST